MFAKDTSDKRLNQNIQRTLKTNNKNINDLIKKWPKTLTYSSPKKIYRWHISF